MFKREIKVGNAVIEYSGSDHVIERINCTDRIEEEIIIQVNLSSEEASTYRLNLLKKVPVNGFEAGV